MYLGRVADKDDVGQGVSDDAVGGIESARFGTLGEYYAPAMCASVACEFFKQCHDDVCMFWFERICFCYAVAKVRIFFRIVSIEVVASPVIRSTPLPQRSAAEVYCLR